LTQPNESIIREIDGILTNAHNHSCLRRAPFARVAFWNKFGTPEAISHGRTRELAPEHPDVLALVVRSRETSGPREAMADPNGKCPLERLTSITGPNTQSSIRSAALTRPPRPQPLHAEARNA
jgi:hypothetical protein